MGLTQKLGTIPLAIFTDASNNIGIGGSPSGSYKFEVTGTARVSGLLTGANATFGSTGTGNNIIALSNNDQSNTRLRITNTGSGGQTFSIVGGNPGASNAGLAIFDETNSATRLYVSSAGNVGIGTSSPSYKLDVQNGSDFDIRLRDTSLGGTVGILFETANDFSGTSQAYIKGIGSAGAGTSQLIFGTAGASGDTTATERMRITSGGDVGIGNANAVEHRLLVAGRDASSSYYALVVTNNSLGTLLAIRNDGLFQTGTSSGSPYNNTSGAAANVVVNSSGTLERATSSLKYKKEIRDYDKGLLEVMQMRPVYYKGKSENDGDKQYAGLIAEEINELGLEEFVVYAEDGSPDALAYQNMVSLLVKAIQELNDKVSALENKS